MNNHFARNFIFIFCLIFSFKINSQYKPEDTEVWNPEPTVINPGKKNQPPSDAVILFDGKDFSKWKVFGKNSPVEWTINKDGSMTVFPGKGAIETKE